MTIDVSTGIAILASIMAIIFGVLAARSRFGVESKDTGKQNGQLISDIGYVKSGVDDIKRKQEKQDEQHIEVISRIVCVEGSTKQAHHRIDSVEENIRKYGQYDLTGLK